MDALPRTDVHASFAHDAFTLINMNELFRLYSLAQVVSVNFDELILS